MAGVGRIHAAIRWGAFCAEAAVGATLALADWPARNCEAALVVDKNRGGVDGPTSGDHWGAAAAFLQPLRGSSAQCGELVE